MDKGSFESATDTLVDACQMAPLTGKGSVHGLTRREIDVMGLIEEGLSNKLIGVRLDISPDTAKFHVNNAIKKLGCSNRFQAVAKAIRKGII